MTFKFRKPICAIAAVYLVTRFVSAAVIIGNYPQANDNTFSTIAATSGNLSKAAGFTLPSGTNYTLDSIILRLDVTNASSSVTFSLFGDVDGNPGGLPLLSFTTQTLTAGISDYTLLPSASFTLQTLNTYWIAATGISPSIDGVTWLASNPGVTPNGIATSAGFRSDSSGTYPPARSSTIQNTYQVSGTIVPEPSSVALALLTSTGMLTFRRYRRL